MGQAVWIEWVAGVLLLQGWFPAGGEVLRGHFAGGRSGQRRCGDLHGWAG